MCIIKNINYNLVTEAELDVTLHQMESNLMNDILHKIIDLAHSDSNIIITGEPGTGKHWFSKLIFALDESPDSTLYHLSCDHLKTRDTFQISEQTEDDLYKVFSKNGKGIVLIDNFSELTTDAQVLLLEYLVRVQELHKAQDLTDKNGIRFIFTMQNHWNRSNTKSYIWSYLFDLLNPISVVIPPLREHREDIYPFTNLFIRQQMEQHNWDSGSSRNLKISDQALYRCITYDWPGNIRQLKNAITHAYYGTKGDIIQPDDLPVSIEMSSFYTCSENSRSWSYINAERKLFNMSNTHTSNKLFDMNIASILKNIITTNR